MAFTFIDLFAGIGGMRLGFEEVGGTCVFTSEWNRFARQTYAANFGIDDPDDEHEIWGDITQVQDVAAKVPDHEILAAGFPCQPFSIAGVSKKKALGRKHGFEDETQGTLFFDVARIIAVKRPKAFLLENVKNLRTHDKGRTLDVILRTLDDLGYHVPAPRVVDAAGFVPQHRERIFIIGVDRELGIKFDPDDAVIPSPGSGPRLQEILEPASDVDSKYTLTPRLWQYLQDYARKHKAAGNGFGFGLVGPEDVARTMSARYYKDGSEILISRGKGRIPRRLTPREAARLMGFDVARLPVHAERYGTDEWLIPVSDTQAYRQFGNAVVPEVVAALAKALVAAISGTVDCEQARADKPEPALAA